MKTENTPSTIRSLTIKKHEFRLVQKGERFFGLIDGKIVADGENDEEVWRLLLQDRATKTSRYFGIEGARRLFLHYYPNGFGSRGYVDLGERGYKVAAKAKLDQVAPLERAASERGLAEVVLSVFNVTNLASMYEKMRIRDALESKDADLFIQAAARFALGEDRRRSLRDMENALKSHGAAKWTSVTYLPFLWKPEEHMYLKPESTVDFAERTHHRFSSAYSSTLDARIYDHLLDLAKRTHEQIADLGPRDNIDIQSFIWVVSGAYDGEAPRP